MFLSRKLIAPTPTIEEQASEILGTLPSRISDVVTAVG